MKRQSAHGGDQKTHRMPYLYRKYLDLQLGQFSCPLPGMTGTFVCSIENLFENFGTPVKTVLTGMGNPRKLVEILPVVIIVNPISSAR